MNKKRGFAILSDACRRQTIHRLLESYINTCRLSDDDDKSAPSLKKKSGRFPNLAGFCRFYRVNLDDIEKLSEEFPDEIAYIFAILEDEALNSGLPPAVLSAYLKRRLGYDRYADAEDGSGEISIRFEHDIYYDGE